MKIQTFSIVTGTTACNAHCPYCISKMTPNQLVTIKDQVINWRNFDKACRLAQIAGVTTVLMTGKGEPTLYPLQIRDVLEHLQTYDFPLIELQTNGIRLGKAFGLGISYLHEWYKLGLTTIAISIAHYDKEKNREIFTPKEEYIDLDDLIRTLHDIGFSVRLSCVLIDGYIDNNVEVGHMINYARGLKVEQLSLRKLARPLKSNDDETYNWTCSHMIDDDYLNAMEIGIASFGNKLMTLDNGAVIYDVDGQNVCWADALTIKPETDSLRQIIFFPDGHLRYDWQFKGATLI